MWAATCSTGLSFALHLAWWIEQHTWRHFRGHRPHNIHKTQPLFLTFPVSHKNVEWQLTNERHTSVGCPQLVGGDACVVPVTILCHVSHCEDRSGVEVLDVDPLTINNPEHRTQLQQMKLLSLVHPSVDVQTAQCFSTLFKRSIYPSVCCDCFGETLEGLRGREKLPRGEPTGRHLTHRSLLCCRCKGDSNKSYSSCAWHLCGETDKCQIVYCGFCHAL